MYNLSLYLKYDEHPCPLGIIVNEDRLKMLLKNKHDEFFIKTVTLIVTLIGNSAPQEKILDKVNFNVKKSLNLGMNLIGKMLKKNDYDEIKAPEFLPSKFSHLYEIPIEKIIFIQKLWKGCLVRKKFNSKSY